MVANAADRRLDQAKYQIERTQVEVNNLDSAMQQLEQQKRSLCNELSEMKAQLAGKNNEIASLHELIDKIQDDKSKLSKRVTKLLENEKELVQELDYLKNCSRAKSTSSSNLQRSNSTKSLTAKLDSHIKNIEHERDYFKQEVETLQRLLKSSQSSGQSITVASCSPTTRRVSFNHRSRCDDDDAENTGSPKRAKSGSPGLLIKSNRCSVCATKCAATSPTRSSTVLIKSTSPLRQCNEEARQLRKEKEELQCLLEKFERHMAEIQANVKVVTSERDRVTQLYEESRCDLQNARRELIKCAKNSNASLAMQTVLKRVESERDTALFDLRSVTNDRDSFKERLRLTTETAIKEKACLEQQVEDLQVCIRNLEMDKKDLCQQISMLQSQLDEYESKMHSQNYQLAQTSQDLSEQKSAAAQIRMLAEESDRALEEQRRQYVMKCDELHKAEQDKFRCEQKISKILKILLLRGSSFD